jgi:regulator of sigma E protease
MEALAYVTDWILPFVVVFTVLVFVHEMGHYWVARANGVRVEVFSIGFGPEVWGRTDRAGTRWKISAVPLGGYVKMFGEHDFSNDEDQPPLTPAEQAVSFHHKRLGQRAAIVAAGPIANLLFAVVLLAGLFTGVGIPMPLAAVGKVQEGSPAAAAGLQPGDRIIGIGDEDVRWFDDLRRIVRGNPGAPLRFRVVRGDSELELTAVPRSVESGAENGERKIGLLGVSPDPTQVGYERMNLLDAVWTAAERTVALTGQILQALWQIVTGARTADELGGPLRIAQLSGQMAQDGWVSMVFFMAALSINLGLINLFPIPMLDGGHLTFYAVEAVRGRPLDQKIQEYGFRVGLVLVLLLMIFATWNDLVHLEVVQFVKKLVT